MKALSAPSLDLFPCNQRASLCSRPGIAFAKQEADQRRIGYGFRHSVFRTKSVRSISASASVPAPTTEEHQELTEFNSEVERTVLVRFKLMKECAFGQQFLIVGDNPVLGEWNPSGGVPLSWSEGHVWTADVYVPMGKAIKYKFILMDATEAIAWQPGPDRMIKPWDTEKTITIFEDWSNPELQNIVEDEHGIHDFNTEDLIMADSPIAADSIANGAPIVTENIAKEMRTEDLSSNDNLTIPQLEEMALENNGSTMNATSNDLFGSEDGTRLVSDDEVPVLVPGLDMVPSEEIEGPELTQAENSILDNAQVDVLSEPKLNEEHATASGRQQNDQEHLENVLEKDMQWGKRTILKFLSGFGFQ